MEFYDYDTRVAAYAVIVDGDRILLSWWNGEGRSTPAWSLPGGGVDLAETAEQGAIREVDGSTDYADWLPITSVPDLPHVGLVDVALTAWLERR